MNRINQLFQTKKTGILSIYFCAGHPTLKGTATTIRTLAKNGIDMIEVGIASVDAVFDWKKFQRENEGCF